MGNIISQQITTGDSTITQGVAYTLGDFVICMVVAILLGSLIALVYGMTNQESGRNFLVTVALLTPIVSLVIMMVNGNLGTGLAGLGAFSLVRFRSVPGQGKEITVIFLSMAIGLAVGTGYLVLASISTIGLLIFSFIFQSLLIGKEDNKDRILTITIPENLNYVEMFDDILRRYTDFNSILEVKTTNMGSLFRLKYSIRLKDKMKEKEMIDILRTKNGNLEISSSLVMEDSGRL
mgnify:CR=1 FL=1